MRVQIIGLGIVGEAQAYLLHKLNHEVYAYDIRAKNRSPYVSFLKDPRSDVDISFICTPESQVENAVENLIENDVRGLYTIKSTTPPGATKDLMKKYQVHICHNPEFLREKYAFGDVENPSRIIIGQCCSTHGRLLEHLYEPLKKPVYITDPTTSEFVKLTVNSLRATVITFWNEIHELATSLHIDSREVAELVDQAKTIGTWEGGNWGTRFFGRKFGGKCLSKDLRSLIGCFVERGFNPHLFKAIEKFNEEVRN